MAGYSRWGCAEERVGYNTREFCGEGLDPIVTCSWRLLVRPRAAEGDGTPRLQVHIGVDEEEKREG